MHNSYLKIDWFIEPDDENQALGSDEMILDLDNKLYNRYKDEIKNPVTIIYSGLDNFMEDSIRDAGDSIIDELAISYIVDKINKELNPPKFIKGEKYNIMRSIDWERPSFGEFILVFEAGGSGPDHNGEYDSYLDCVGVLGEEVKLVY